MLRSKKAEKLQVGDKLALPFGKTATIARVKVGQKFVNLQYREQDIYAGRIERHQEVLIEVDD